MFRSVQALTGAVISGSTALQFFARAHWTASDLDVYVEHSSGYLMALFLISIGYDFEPTNSQNWSISDAYDQINLTEVYDDGRGFACVFNFHRGSSKIQLITATYSPIDIILNFHSTVVMNLITARHAFCLYPQASFEEHTSLITFRDEGIDRNFAWEKYVERGWTLVNADGSLWGVWNNEDAPTLPLDSFQLSKPRHIGDRFSWTIKLSPLRTAARDYTQDTLTWISSLPYSIPRPLIVTASRDNLELFTAHSWILTHSGLAVTASYIVLQDPVVKYVYCFVKERTLLELIHQWVLDARQKMEGKQKVGLVGAFAHALMTLLQKISKPQPPQTEPEIEINDTQLHSLAMQYYMRWRGAV
ncbi:hypothetical protein VKT23_015312 [Stygiomarasmius scandens]|uniref:Uncharacterized protein n=1 Tax=Marasmiellus scandens TaxID=2682957 RepID=A0ABR1IXZ6_9AGAR